MIMALVVINILCFWVWGLFARHYAGYQLMMIAHDTLPFALTALCVMGVTWYTTRFIDSLPLLLLARISMASLLYFVIMKIAGVVVLKEIIAFVREKTRRKQKT